MWEYITEEMLEAMPVIQAMRRVCTGRRPALASRATRRATRSGLGDRTPLVTRWTTSTAVSGSVRHAAWTASGRAPRRVRSQ